MADFENRFISQIFVVFSSSFFPQNNSGVVVESFLACFWQFDTLSLSDHFVKAIASPKGMAFARWPILKISLLEYLVLFSSGILHKTTLMWLQNRFWHVFGNFTF